MFDFDTLVQMRGLCARVRDHSAIAISSFPVWRAFCNKKNMTRENGHQIKR
jgi:hypothetical protein